MKKLLGVIGILGLAAAFLPVQGYADLRGAFAPLTIASGFVNGCEQPAFRPGNTITIAGQGNYERWFAFSTRSLVPGSETVRSIYQHLDSQQSGTFAPLLDDPSVQTSYADPAWSFDGKFLAYSQLDAGSTQASIYVQEFAGPTSSLGLSSTPVGAPVQIVAGSPGVTHRHPDWSPGPNYTLTYDSNAALLSRDIWTVDVTVAGGHVVGAGIPVRRTFSDIKAEQNPAWSPNGHDICFSSNVFGPNILQIIDLNLASNDPGYTRLAEINFSFVSHNNPSYSPDGTKLMYDAPTGEDPTGVSDVWLLDLNTQTKCEIQFDNRADSDPDVSSLTQTSPDGLSYNGFIFTSQGSNFGVATWRATPVTSCYAPLSMGVAVVPAVYNLKNTHKTDPIVTVMSLPAGTKSLGYQCSSFNGPNEGVKLRASILASPTLLGLASGAIAGDGVVGTDCFDSLRVEDGELLIRCNWDRQTIVDRFTSLGLLNQVVPMQMTAYSNNVGRGFQGFGYIKITKSSLAGSVALLGNSPNPFNPVTTIKFSVSTPGNVTLRIFDVRGALVKTLVSGRYDAGTHEAMWDGTTTRGIHAASGVYYAKITGADNTFDTQRLVMAK